MAKFLVVVLLLAGAFGAGYYLGQRPVGTLQRTVAELQQSLKDMSRNVLDTTLGIERDLRQRQGLVEAKSRLVQAKAHFADRNFGDAAKELSEAVNAVETITKGAKPDSTNASTGHGRIAAGGEGGNCDGKTGVVEKAGRAPAENGSTAE